VVDVTQYQFFNTLQAMTEAGWLTRDLIDTVFKDGKIFKWLRSNDRVKYIDGAPVFKWNVNIGRSPNTQAFDGVEPLALTSMDANAINAVLQPKRYTDALVLPIGTIQDNDGSENAIASIVRTQLEVTKATLVEKLSTDSLTNTQTANPLQINGLAEAVDDGTVATTYAGLSRTTYAANWRSPANYASTMAALLTTITNLDLQASVDGQRPTAYFGTPGIFGGIQGLLQSYNQYQDAAILAKNVVGYDLMLFGKPLFIDQYLPSGVPVPTGITPPSGTNAGGYLYGLNGSFLNLNVYRRWNFATTAWDRQMANVAAIYSRFFWTGNLSMLKPSSSWVAWVQGG
jgi:hypothetical protein